MRRLLFAALLPLGLASLPAAAAPDCRSIQPEAGLEEIRVLFATGSSALDATAQQQITRSAGRIKGTFANEVCLVGRASRIGNAQQNLALSRARIAAVKNALVRQGVQGGVLGSRPEGATFERSTGGPNSDAERSVAIIIVRAGGQTRPGSGS